MSIESILDLADRVDVGRATQENETKISEKPVGAETPKSSLVSSDVTHGDIINKYAFAAPEDISLMMNYFLLDPAGMDDAKVGKLKEIYDMFREQDMPLSDFLSENGLKIGSRLNPGFLDKLYVYLRLDSEEKKLKKDLLYKSKEKSLYEDRSRL